MYSLRLSKGVSFLHTMICLNLLYTVYLVQRFLSSDWLNCVHYCNFLQHQITKHPIALRLGRQECKNYLLLHSAFTFTLECSVFPIQSSDVFSKNEANKKEKLYVGQMQQAFLRRVRRTACKMFCSS